MLVTPSNPTGKILDESELRRSGGIAKELGLLILLDDPCRHFIYEVGNRNMGTVAGVKLGPSNDSLFPTEKEPNSELPEFKENLWV